MTFVWPSPGASDTAPYLIAGIPFLFSATIPVNPTALRVKFPTVTKKITVRSLRTGDFFVGFTENGVKDNPAGINRRILVSAGQEPCFEMRVKEIWFYRRPGGSGDPSFDLIASLTQIPVYHFPTLTGSVDPVTGIVPPLFRGVG